MELTDQIYLYFETYGCVANKNNTEIMKGLALQSGLQITNNIDIADILVINTCIVKGRTEKKIERRIKDLLQLNKTIIIAGCMPEVRSKKLQKLFDEKELYLLGTHHVKDICKLVKKIIDERYTSEEFLEFQNEQKLLTGKIPEKKDVGITQISEGCIGNCSFCLTKLAKHKLYSYPQEKIIENIKNDLDSGAKIIHITSQDNASYGLDKGEQKLPELLKKIIQLKGKFKIKIGMMNPNNVLPILDKLIEIYKNEKIEKFIHIPLQSGSDKILEKMNRKYQVKDFVKIINKFRKEIPDIIIWTDIIIGFPGETEKDFQKTLNIIKQIKPDFINYSRFWSMKGTKAEKMKQLDVKIVKQRIKKFKQFYDEL